MSSKPTDRAVRALQRAESHRNFNVPDMPEDWAVRLIGACIVVHDFAQEAAIWPRPHPYAAQVFGPDSTLGRANRAAMLGLKWEAC